MMQDNDSDDFKRVKDLIFMSRSIVGPIINGFAHIKEHKDLKLMLVLCYQMNHEIEDIISKYEFRIKKMEQL